MNERSISDMIIEELIKYENEKEFKKNFEIPIIELELERAFEFLTKQEENK